MTKRHAKIFKVLIGQMGQNGDVDVVLGKALRVLTRPSLSSQSAICCIAGLRPAATLGTAWRFSFSALLGRALAGLLPAREGFFIASTHRWERGIVAGPESTGHGLQCFGVGVERRDILRRNTRRRCAEGSSGKPRLPRGCASGCT